MKPTISLLFSLFFSCNLNAAVIMHSGFEQPDVGPNYNAYFPGTEIDGWTIEAGSVEIVGTYWQAAEGKQSLDLSGIGDLAGTIYRDIQTVPGQQYKLRFAFSGNPGDGAIKQMKAFWNDSEVADLSFDTRDTSSTNMGYQYHEYILTATAALTRLKFQSLTMNFLGPVIDDVSVTEVISGVNLQIKTYAGLWLDGTPGSRQEIQYSVVGGPAENWRSLITVTIPEEGRLFFLDPEPVKTNQRIYRTVQVQ